jgi:hypothetical protein
MDLLHGSDPAIAAFCEGLNETAGPPIAQNSAELTDVLIDSSRLYVGVPDGVYEFVP